jgi:HEAT repeat protein
VCNFASDALVRIGEPAVTPLKDVVVKGEWDPDVRMRAAGVLGKIGKPAARAAPALEARLHKERSSTVRAWVLDALVQLTADQAKRLTILEAALGDESAEVRDCATNLLRSMGSSAAPAADSLRQLLPDRENVWVSPGAPDMAQEEPVRLHAVVALSSIGPSAREAVPDLARLIQEDAELSVRAAAAIALGELRAADKHSIEVLTKAMREDADIRVKAAAAGSLALLEQDNRVAFETLLGFLQIKPDDEDYLLGVSSAADALVRMGAKAAAALPALEACLHSAEFEVQFAGVDAIAAIGGPEAEKMLQKVAADDDSPIQIEAKYALEEMKVDAKNR